MRHMTGSRASLWGLWAGFVALLGLELLFAEHLAAGRGYPWDGAMTSVAGFVLGVIAAALGVWTFALREGLALRDVRSGALDPATPEGLFRLRRVLVALWTLCLLIGLLGEVVAWGAGAARLSWPYLAGAGVLLLLHAPREWVFAVPPAAGA
jgi:hypothetical protein